jgi:hypothetical protein
MMSRLLPRVLVIAAFAAATLPTPLVWAQGGVSGSITGTVTDQNGQPLKGVKLHATSETQIGGGKTAYTNEEGTFRILGLIPGKFEVTASAPKLKTVIQKDVNVGVNAAAEADLIMEVETSVEEVKVVERAPLVSTTTASVKEVFDEEFVDNLPSDFKAGAEYVTAVTVPGAVTAGVRSTRIRGGSSAQTVYQVEGFHMTGQRSTLKGMAAIEVLSAGYGAEHATVAGGVVNMVTKSGSNKYELDLTGYTEDSNFRFFLQPTDSRQHSYFAVLNPNFSGPIIKDKLWFFVNLEGRREQYAADEDPLGIHPTNPDRWYGSMRGSGKLTWQISSRHKLVSFTNFNLRVDHDTRQGYDPAVEKEAQARQDDTDIFTGLIWEALLTDNIFFKSQAGVQRFNQHLMPTMCLTDPIECGNVASERDTFPRDRRFGNYDTMRQRVTDKLQFINMLDWFASTGMGEHNVKLKNDYYIESFEEARAMPGDMAIRWNNGAPDRIQYFYANDPRLEEARTGWHIRTSTSWKNVTSLSDSMRLGRYLTVTPGVAFTKTQAYNNVGETALDVMAFTPHLAAAWDATHDGRTVLRGSFNQYLDVDAQVIARHTVGGPVTQTCRWDTTTLAYSRDCVYEGGSTGATIGSPCGPDGVAEDGSDCRQNLKVPRTWEYTIGAEREVVSGLALGLDVIYRRYTNPYEVVETNRIWNASGTDLSTEGGYRNGRATTVQDMETPDDAERSYLGSTVSVHKRQGAFKLTGSYTLSFLRGNVLDGTGNRYGDIAPRDVYLDGYLSDDSRHNIRASATYQWTRWLTTGVIYDYRSGRPYDRRFYNAVTGGYDDYRAPVGINPGSNLNDPADDREQRLPDQQLVSVQLRFNLKPLIGVHLEAYVDVLNALALRTTTNLIQEDGPNFARMSDDQDPFRLRLGGRYKF